MRIATWNINGIRARLDFILHWLRTRSPDIIGLQELKTPDEYFPHAEFAAEGYTVFTHGQKSWNGVAILTRKEGKISQKGLPGQEDFGARLLTAEIGDLSFTTVYCPNGKNLDHEDFQRKLVWLDELHAHMTTSHSIENNTVLCGDFNIVPAPIDSWGKEKFEGSLFHTQKERQRFQHFLDWGLLDLYREQNPEAEEFSWWDYRGGAFHKKQGYASILFWVRQKLQNA